MNPKKDIKQFVANVANKDYSQANSSLQKMIENKLKERIKSTLDIRK
jgi:hypothetical protein